jgi:hypothetical protein
VEALIEWLAVDLRPLPAGAVTRRLVVPTIVGVVVSVVMVWATLGYRPDMLQAVATAVFWVKLGYTLALAGLSLWALERLGRPATPAAERVIWLAAPVAVVGALCAAQLTPMAGDQRLSALMGTTALVCPWRILLFSAPPFLALLWAMRGLAPTSLRATGAVLGLCAGGFGAGAYALACTESTIPFLGAWYSLAILGLSLVGCMTAPWTLRW